MHNRSRSVFPKERSYISKPTPPRTSELRWSQYFDTIVLMATAIEKLYLRSDIPVIRPGDTIEVVQKIKEGGKDRLSRFEGIVIAKKHGRGISATFTVRKVVDGLGVERIFPLHSPTISQVNVLQHSKVRRAKLYHIRERAAREVRRKMKKIWKEIPVSEPESVVMQSTETTSEEKF